MSILPPVGSLVDTPLTLEQAVVRSSDRLDGGDDSLYREV